MSGEYKGKIMTVLGPIAPGEIGVTQMHEHMIIDFLTVSGSAQQSHQKAFAGTGGEFDWEEPISLSNYYAVRRNPFLLKEAMQLIDADLIIVEEVARCVLEVPFHLAGVDIEAERRVGVEIVARAVFRIEHRRRLAGAPER